MTDSDVSIPDESSGVVYIAFGEKYRKEACVSMASLRRESPGIKVAVITDEPWDLAGGADEVVLRPRVEGWRCKPRYMYDSPFRKSLFLDTDTLVVRDISPVFDLLEYYDIGVHFDGAQLKTGKLAAHCQCNSGVVLFKKHPLVQEVFVRWLQEYAEALGSKPGSMSLDVRGLGDQRYLAIAIAKSKARPVHLPNYLNCFIHDYNVLYTPPAVIHGRMPWMEGLASQMGIGRSWRAEDAYVGRLWMPNIRGLLPNGVRWSDPFLALALLFRRLMNEVRRRQYAFRARTGKGK